MVFMKKFFILAALLLSASPAAAAPDMAAYDLFTRGEYQAAVDRAVAKGSAEDLALAARALNAISYFDFDRKAVRERADRALALAEQAIVLDARLPDARLQAGISHSIKGSRMAPARALFSGVAGKARARLDEALLLAPEDASVLSTSAAWRIEVARKGGGALKGADPQKGFEEMVKARALAPDDSVIAYECAYRLIGDGRKEWRAMALDCLGAALGAEPALKFESDMQKLARGLKAAVDAGPKAEKAFIAAQP